MPIRSSVTVSLVPEAKGGPFVFWDDLPAALKIAKALGFDAVEIFPPSADSVDMGHLRTLLGDQGLGLAAMGTGAAAVVQRLYQSGKGPRLRHRRTRRLHPGTTRQTNRR